MIERGKEFLNKEQVWKNIMIEQKKMRNQIKSHRGLVRNMAKLILSREEILKARLFLQQNGEELYPSNYDISQK